MFTLPLHPMLVHLPIGIGLLTPCLALITLARISRDNSLRALPWVLVVLCQGATFASGIAAAQTGEGDEERVERIVHEAHIETHEDNAQLFNVLAGAAMVCGIAAFALRATPARAVAALAVVGSVAAAAQGIRTGHTGGILVYREGAAAAHVPAGSSHSAPAAPREDHEDD